ncbi:MAG: peptidoglycan-binding protein LysM [Acidobacteria bacterium]|nr:peptidoglycan-binding protein LysM [Acidobacteriota bacterium]
MGLFDFIRELGKKVMPGNEAEEIQADITKLLGDRVENLSVKYDDGAVTLGGLVDSQATKEKVVLLAGNVKGVAKVDDAGLSVKPAPEPPKEPEPEFTFYTIVSGDSLWKIASKFYGNGAKWNALFEANREVIQDPDKIYPGQVIRVPKASA